MLQAEKWGCCFGKTEDTVVNEEPESDGVRSDRIKEADEVPLLKEGTGKGTRKMINMNILRVKLCSPCLITLVSVYWWTVYHVLNIC